MNPFLQQIQQLWARQEPAGRMMLGGASVLLVLAVAGVGYWASQTNYAVLYSGLTTEEAAAITQKLDADRTPYKLSSDGTGILVPTDRVQKARMGLAMAGALPGNEKGFEIFDTMSMGATTFVQNMNYVRAIQGELVKTIMTLQPVAHARVHIVQPEPSPFVRDDKPVTASVVIKIRAGSSLNRTATQGIVALVAGSVKGLTADNVTVLDTDGRLLSEGQRSAHGMASASQLAHQLEVESHLAAKAQEILTRLLGPGRAVVRVTADMSFKHVKETSEKFDPAGKVVTQESVMSSKTTSPGGPRGPAGTASNIPPGTAGAAASAGPTANEEVLESKSVVSSTNRSQEEQQESINRLTVAVMLIPPVPVDEKPLEESLGVTADEVGLLVQQAVGFKEGRDQIQVSIGRPAQVPADEALDRQIIGAQNWQNYGTIAKASSLGVAAFSLLAIGLLALRRRSPSGSAPAVPVFATAGTGTGTASDLDDLHAVAGTIKAWLEEPGIRMDRSKPPQSSAGR
jgi:flagellar M-ring protein FliF